MGGVMCGGFCQHHITSFALRNPTDWIASSNSPFSIELEPGFAMTSSVRENNNFPDTLTFFSFEDQILGEGSFDCV